MTLFAAAYVYWQLPVVLVLISLVYSATRFDRWSSIFIEAFRWGIRMAGFLCGIGLVLYILSLIIT
jgi:hypothetical protein